MGCEWVHFGALADVIGRDAAAALCGEMGGVPVYVPAAPRPGHDLERIVGRQALLALAAVYGGARIMVPNLRRGQPRKGEILELLGRGLSRRDIALRLCVTQRYVELVAQRARPAAVQASLPGIS